MFFDTPDAPQILVEWHGCNGGLRIVLLADDDGDSSPDGRVLVEGTSRDAMGANRWISVPDRRRERNALAFAVVLATLQPGGPFHEGGPLAVFADGRWLYDRRDPATVDSNGEPLDPEELAEAYGEDPR